MRLQVKGKNVEVTPSVREYAERKLAKLGKQLAEETQVEVELSEERNPSIADNQVARRRSSPRGRRCGRASRAAT
jgi:Ribosome-associated protein Y (PSrp-1)